MAKHPYVLTTNKFKEFMNKITTIGTPPKATVEWLRSIGYTSSNHRRFLDVLEFIGLIDQQHVPTDKWTQYRSDRSVIATCIASGYHDLFKLYPRANARTGVELEAFFKSHNPGLAERATKAVVKTFQALCEIADFNSKDIAEADPGPTTPPETPNTTGGKEPESEASLENCRPSVNINIELALPASKDSDVYDALFEAMKKHLF